MNAQPIVIDCNKGKLALGHNGNLPRRGKMGRTLEHRGSIFQTTSDRSNCALVARSQARIFPARLPTRLNQVKAIFAAGVDAR